MNIFSKKWLAVAAGLALSSVSALAAPLPVLTFSPESFIVNPTAVGETQRPFTAGSINFDYRALVNQAAGVGSTSPFTENGTARFTSFLTGVGGTPIGANTTGLNLGGVGDPTGYSLYAQFVATGTATTNGAGGIDGTFNTFTINFFVDRNNDTTFNTPGVSCLPLRRAVLQTTSTC